MNRKFSRIVLGLALVLALLTACQAGTDIDVNAIATQVAATISVELSTIAQAATDQAAAQLSETPAPTQTPEATVTPLPSNTPEPTATLALAAPKVSVSVDTNCRKGPGQVYDIAGALKVGETANVIAVPIDGRDYAVIQAPVGGRCWLWLEYATITGDLAGLPQWDIPITPTPVPGSIAGIVWNDLCKQGATGDPPKGCVKPVTTGDPYPANGTKDAGEVVYGGIQVELGAGACPKDGFAVMDTGADGSFKFSNLQPGTYCVIVNEDIAQNVAILGGGKWTAPNASGMLTVELGSGQNLSISFGWDIDGD